MEWVIFEDFYKKSINSDESCDVCEKTIRAGESAMIHPDEEIVVHPACFARRSRLSRLTTLDGQPIGGIVYPLGRPSPSDIDAAVRGYLTHTDDRRFGPFHDVIDGECPDCTSNEGTDEGDVVVCSGCGVDWSKDEWMDVR